MWLPLTYRLGEVCSHIAAVLFKVETIVRLGYTTVPCTSRPCEWNQAFSKKVYINIGVVKVILLPYTSLFYILQVSAARIVDIDFSKPKRLSTNEVCTAHDVEAVTGVKQP